MSPQHPLSTFPLNIPSQNPLSTLPLDASSGHSLHPLDILSSQSLASAPIGSEVKNKSTCIFFKRGFCRYGHECRYGHHENESARRIYSRTRQRHKFSRRASLLITDPSELPSRSKSSGSTQDKNKNAKNAKNAKKQAVKMWLRGLDLESYFKKFEEHKYDNMKMIKALDDSKIQEMIRVVGIKPESAVKIKKSLKEISKPKKKTSIYYVEYNTRTEGWLRNGRITKKNKDNTYELIQNNNTIAHRWPAYALRPQMELLTKISKVK